VKEAFVILVRPIDYKKLFAADEGELLDIRVPDVTINHWERFLNHLTTHYELSYEEGGTPKPLPTFDMIIERYAVTPVTLKIHISDFTVNCFFFDLEEIEMDVSPTDIDSALKANLVFKFMSDVACLLGKLVMLLPEGSDTAEGLRGSALCTADPNTGEISC
jgi:hypothetical protein